ncbi:MAG: hypothetical protein FWB85_04970 [Chitinispirillia bacterium]|nr:hypothetical protein [Chitinispirillia bacterium]
MKRTIVFGGWAVPPDVLVDVFWGGAEYIDINFMMPKLFDKPRCLKDNWAEVVVRECKLTPGAAYYVIAGWSTGAIIAYAAAQICVPKKLILLSATPCFCRKDDYRFGSRPESLERMIGAIELDKHTVLQSFYEWSGLHYDTAMIPDYSVEELLFGLEFLRQVDLRPLTPPQVRPLFLHGVNDSVIPMAASKYFCEETGGEHIELNGGHAFFTGQRMPPEGVEF